MKMKVSLSRLFPVLTFSFQLTSICPFSFQFALLAFSLPCGLSWLVQCAILANSLPSQLRWHFTVCQIICLSELIKSPFLKLYIIIFYYFSYIMLPYLLFITGLLLIFLAFIDMILLIISFILSYRIIHSIISRYLPCYLYEYLFWYVDPVIRYSISICNWLAVASRA